MKPLFSRRSTTEEPVKRKLFTNKSSVTFVQDSATTHTAKATQQWCKKNLPNFIKKDEWPANSTHLNPIENLWSIIDEAAYRNPIPKTMQGRTKIKVTAILAKYTTSKRKGASLFHAATAQNRYTEQWGEETLDIDISTVVKRNNVHKTGKLSLTSDS